MENVEEKAFPKFPSHQNIKKQPVSTLNVQREYLVRLVLHLFSEGS